MRENDQSTQGSPQGSKQNSTQGSPEGSPKGSPERAPEGSREGSLETLFPAPPADLDVVSLDLDAVPAHVAVIMDGNGRWAKEQGLSRGEGHVAGVKGVREAITICNDIGVKYLTLYSFSTENWKRPKKEVSGLMDLFASTLAKELVELSKKGVRLLVLGDLSKLPRRTKATFESAIDSTAGNTGLTLTVAVNYGSRTEITDACRELATLCKEGSLKPDDIDEKTFASHLESEKQAIPDPDLLVRTSGECRISNFLLWQIAYSEIYITETLWPDFDRYEFARAIIEYQRRERRYGGV